jgi:hypothetical protein
MEFPTSEIIMIMQYAKIRKPLIAEGSEWKHIASLTLLRVERFPVSFIITSAHAILTGNP